MIKGQELFSIWNQVCSQHDLVKALNRLQIYSKDIFTHSIEVGALSMALGASIGVKSKMDIFVSGLFHDYGKIQIPKSIIEKPGKLTEEEIRVMNIHPFLGYSELKQTTRLSAEILHGVLDHHERVDGSGYSYGKKGPDISQFGKIIAIADVYSAMSTKRVYRSHAYSHLDIIQEFKRYAGTSYDEQMVVAFSKISDTIQEISDKEFIKNFRIRQLPEMEVYQRKEWITT